MTTSDDALPADALEAMQAELAIRRKSGSASARLHNLCEGIAESADGSEWSREEWERIDDENSALRARVKELEAMQADAARYRWLRGGADIPLESNRWARWEVRYWCGRWWSTMFADQLDAAIDAARGQE